MSIIKTIGRYEFISEMTDASSMSAEGAEALFEYLDDSGDDIELDAIALSNEYTELDIPNNLEYHRKVNPDLTEQEAIEELEDESIDPYAYLDDEDKILEFHDMSSARAVIFAKTSVIVSE